MKKISCTKEEQRKARHSLVTGYRQESNFTQAELAGLLVLLSSVTHSGVCGPHVYDIPMDAGTYQLVKQDTLL